MHSINSCFFIGIAAGVWIAQHSMGSVAQNVIHLVLSVWTIGIMIVFFSITFWILTLVLGGICIFLDNK